ncbi:MAG: hypothetical protein V4530_09480 [Pseudomonadota bacterium]
MSHTGTDNENRRPRKSRPKPDPELAIMRSDFFVGHPGMPRNREYWVSRALLVGEYRDRPELFEMLEATEFSDAISIESWTTASKSYPSSPLPQGKAKKRANLNVPVRAFILKQALTQLLSLVGAPDNMKADLGVLLDSFHDKPAKGRAKLQGLLIDHPDKTWAEVIKLAKPYPSRQGMEDRALGDLIHNTELVRHPPTTAS